MEIPILSDLLIILGLSVLVLLVFLKLKLPPIIGFLTTGVVAGPSVLGWVSASHDVEILAEIGVILLLFAIGLEFSLKKLMTIKKAVFLGGSLQVFLTIGLVYLLGTFFDLPPKTALFSGFLIALSSTAIVLKILQASGEITAPHGNNILAVLIFQDIIVVPMMLMTPLLGDYQAEETISWEQMTLKAVLVIGGVIVGARYVIPALLFQVAKTKSKELFILLVFVICFSVAWLTASIGLSLALGAFLAGLIISESEYSYQAVSNILPFYEIFTSIFFVSIGMLLDVQFLWDHIGWILLATLGIIVGKALIAMLAAKSLKLNLRTVILVGLSIAQVGEFSFILAKVGLENKVIDDAFYQYFLSISVVSMAFTPFIIRYAHHLVNLVLKLPISKRLSRSFEKSEIECLDEENDQKLQDHLIIIGFGINGENLSLAAEKSNIPHVIIEMNAQTVVDKQKEGLPIIYGDASQPHVLEHAHIERSRIVVVAISDPFATRMIVDQIKKHFPETFIIVRTRFVNDVADLYQMGADEVIPEEFETSIEIFSKVLEKYLIPKEDIMKLTNHIRGNTYQMFREHSINSDVRVQLPQLNTVKVKVPPNHEWHEKSLIDLNLRSSYQISILAIEREQALIENPDGAEVLRSGDLLYIFGHQKAIKDFGQAIKDS